MKHAWSSVVATSLVVLSGRSRPEPPAGAAEAAAGAASHPGGDVGRARLPRSRGSS